MGCINYYKQTLIPLNMIIRYVVITLLCICGMLQIRNYNRYLVDHRRKHDEAGTYLNSDVCSDPITKAQLGTFNLCEKASHIVAENPRSAAFYDILNDWYPCGHGRCDGVIDWLMANIHWFIMLILVIGMMIYFKWVEHQRDVLYTRMRLPTMLAGQPVQHVD
jgi:hypothetical protein